MNDLLSNQLWLGRIVIAGTAALFLLVALGAVVWMTRYPAKSIQRGVGALVVGVLALATPLAQMLSYRRLTGVRVPTDDLFFQWVFCVEMGLVIVTSLARAAWLDWRRTRPSQERL